MTFYRLMRQNLPEVGMFGLKLERIGKKEEEIGLISSEGKKIKGDQECVNGRTN